MCQHEVVGDFYRGCQHFHARYSTGNVIDCEGERCRTSSAHIHKTAKNCGCPEVVSELRHVQSMYQTAYPGCDSVQR